MSQLTELFSDIADAIRIKKGTSENIQAINFADEISNLPSGSSEPTIFSKSLTFVSSTKVTCDISSNYPNYNSITMDNIICMITYLRVHSKAGGNNQTLTWSYDPETGIISLQTTSNFFSANSGTIKIAIFE